MHWASGIPHALFGRKIYANLGRIAPRECGTMSPRHCEERLVRRSSKSEGGSDEAIHSFFARLGARIRAARWHRSDGHCTLLAAQERGGPRAASWFIAVVAQHSPADYRSSFTAWR